MEDEENEVKAGESHMSLAYGGYDDHDLDEEEDDSTKSHGRFWRFVAWSLLIIFAILAIIPILF
jgi:hypothetical protein